MTRSEDNRDKSELRGWKQICSNLNFNIEMYKAFKTKTKNVKGEKMLFCTWVGLLSVLIAILGYFSTNRSQTDRQMLRVGGRGGGSTVLNWRHGIKSRRAGTDAVRRMKSIFWIALQKIIDVVSKNWCSVLWPHPFPFGGILVILLTDLGKLETALINLIHKTTPAIDLH